MQLLILQVMLGETPYFGLSEKINRQYAGRHHYHYKAVHAEIPANRHPHWEVIRLIRDTVRELGDRYDYILYLDADAFFYAQELAIEKELIPLFGEQTRILFAADCGGDRERWNPTKPNAGQMLIRPDELTNKLFDCWVDAETHTPPVHPRTQTALWNDVTAGFSSALTVIPDYFLFAARSGYFIRHLYLDDDINRTREMNRWIELYGMTEDAEPVTEQESRRQGRKRKQSRPEQKTGEMNNNVQTKPTLETQETEE